MALKIFKLPQELQFQNKNIVIGSAVSIVKSSTFNIDDIVDEDVISKSWLGTSVVDNLVIPEGKYIDLQNNIIEYPSVVIDAVTFEVTRAKRIIETKIQGRDSSIFEYIGNSNYEITASGMISNRYNIIPLDTARNLQQIFDIPQQLPVVCQFLNEIFEIFNIVITSSNISQTPGMRNSLPFSFQAKSDVDLDINELE